MQPQRDILEVVTKNLFKSLLTGEDYMDEITEAVDIQSSDKTSVIDKPSQKTKAFGILKRKIKDPVLWQREIRKESDRDIYTSFK